MQNGGFTIVYLFIDTETAGLDCTRSPLLSIAGVFADKEFNATNEFYFELRPNVLKYPVIDATAMQINGLSLERLGLMGRKGDEVAEIIRSMCDMSGINKPRYTLVGWNVRFDRGFLQQIMPDEYNYFNRRDLDLCSVAQFINPYLTRYSLDTMLAFFNLKRDKEHNALQDAKLTLQVAKELRCLQKKSYTT